MIQRSHSNLSLPPSLSISLRTLCVSHSRADAECDWAVLQFVDHEPTNFGNEDLCKNEAPPRPWERSMVSERSSERQTASLWKWLSLLIPSPAVWPHVCMAKGTRRKCVSPPPLCEFGRDPSKNSEPLVDGAEYKPVQLPSRPLNLVSLPPLVRATSSHSRCLPLGSLSCVEPIHA